jgi:uncharacterized protein (TIGR03067 family)
MTSTRILVLTLAVSLPAIGPAQGPAGQPAQDLQGTWRLLSLEYGGKKASLTDEALYLPGKLIVSGNTFTYSIGSEKVAEGTIRVDAKRGPRAVDASGKYFDREVYFIEWAGIYKIEGERLWLCGRLAAGRDGPPAPGQRPAEFKTARGDLAALAILRREGP